MPEPRSWPLVVASVQDVTPDMRRIRLTSPTLEAFDYLPGQDMALGILVDARGMVRRRYTIRRFDRDRRLLDLDIVMHGDGPGIRWARAAHPGVAIEAIGPRGKISPAADADWHLFAGDATAVPGSFAMMEALPGRVRARAYLEVEGPDERQLEIASAPNKTVSWRYASDRYEQPPGGLVAAVSAPEVSPAGGHAYLAGEVALVSGLKAALLARGWGADQISAKAYWNRGRPNAGHGEPELKV